MPTSPTTQKPKRGRPVGSGSKLTPALQAKLIEIITAGNYISTACDAVGITTQAFYGWMDKGKEKKAPLYIDFAAAVKTALVATEQKMVGIVVQAANQGNWQAAMTYLERRRPEQWSRRQIQVEHTGKGGGPITHEHSVTFHGSPEEFEEAIEAIARERDAVPGNSADD